MSEQVLTFGPPTIDRRLPETHENVVNDALSLSVNFRLKGNPNGFIVCSAMVWVESSKYSQSKQVAVLRLSERFIHKINDPRYEIHSWLEPPGKRSFKPVKKDSVIQPDQLLIVNNGKVSRVIPKLPQES